MAVYAIGDVQGCFDELQDLLAGIRFRRGRDRLWFAGDLVNRGPKSLEVLRFVAELGDDAAVALGNHDLHLMAAAAGVRPPRSQDTFQPILDAPDGEALIEWLAGRPLLVREPGIAFTLVHAGLPPQWSVDDAARLAREVEAAVGGNDRQSFLENMYGNKPRRWRESLSGWKRLRFITNALTRLRYVDAEGRLDLDETGPPGSQPDELLPWFEASDRRSRNQPIVFGHWATLQLERALDPTHGVYHLDTGCAWGGRLTALRLDDEKYFSVPSRQPVPAMRSR